MAVTNNIREIREQRAFTRMTLPLLSDTAPKLSAG